MGIDAENLGMFQHKAWLPQNTRMSTQKGRPQAEDETDGGDKDAAFLKQLGLVKGFADTFFFQKEKSIYRKYCSTPYDLAQCEKFQASNDCSCVVYEMYAEIPQLGATI